MQFKYFEYEKNNIAIGIAIIISSLQFITQLYSRQSASFKL